MLGVKSEKFPDCRTGDSALAVKIRKTLLITVQTPRSAFIQGARDQVPVLLGMIPFGMIAGAAPVAAGMEPWLAIAMSVIIYAGAAQLAAIQLMVLHAPVGVVIATVLIVNLRMAMYSAALAPYFRKLSLARRWCYAYLITDHSFAFVTATCKPDDPPEIISAYYRGVASVMWVAWQLCVIAGIVIGARVPASWSLDFTVPLVFLAVVAPALTTRAHFCAASVAAVAAIFTHSMPMRVGLIAAALTGIAVGTWLDARAEKSMMTKSALP